jgi:xylulokinase
MSDQALFLGLDVSTTGSKALLIDNTGEVIGTASTAHTLQTPKPLWSEQNPREWWEASCCKHPQGFGGGR